MTETIRIYRQRVIEYDIQEYVEVTQEDYDKIVAQVGVPLTDPDSAHLFLEYDRAIDDIVGDEWETDLNEPGDDRVVDVWLAEG